VFCDHPLVRGSKCLLRGPILASLLLRPATLLESLPPFIQDSVKFFFWRQWLSGYFVLDSSFPSQFFLPSEFLFPRVFPSDDGALGFRILFSTVGRPCSLGSAIFLRIFWARTSLMVSLPNSNSCNKSSAQVLFFSADLEAMALFFFSWRLFLILPPFLQDLLQDNRILPSSRTFTRSADILPFAISPTTFFSLRPSPLSYFLVPHDVAWPVLFPDCLFRRRFLLLLGPRTAPLRQRRVFSLDIGTSRSFTSLHFPYGLGNGPFSPPP